jgi:ubiquitin
MNWFTLLRAHLSDPEYVHVLINPLPVYGLAIAVIALVLALFLRNQRVSIAALVLVFVTALSAWPTYHYGEAAYDRVKAMSDAAGEQWLDEHMARGEKLIWAFYILAAVSAVGVGVVTKWPRHSLTVSIAALALASGTLGIGGYIAYAGGHVRHREFRFEPAPVARADGHHHGGEDQHGAEQKTETSASGQPEHAVHEEMKQQAGGTAPKSEEEAKQLEASRLQLEASRLQLEASRKQLEAAGGASPIPSPAARGSVSPTPEEEHQHHPPR